MVSRLAAAQDRGRKEEELVKPISSRRRRTIAACVATGLAGLALVVAGCGGDDDEPGGDAGQEEVSLAVFMASLGDGYTRNLNQAIEEKAKAMGATVQTFNATFNPQKQLQQCQDAIVTERFDAFIIQAVAGPSMVSCARQAIEGGLEVVAVSNPIGPDVDTTEPQVDGLTATILESPSTMGRTLAELTTDACGDRDPCEVAYQFGPPDFSFAANSRKVFKEELRDHPAISIVAEGSHLFEPDRARSLTQQVLVAHPELDVLTSDDDPSAAAAHDVIKDRGRQDQIAVIGGAGAREGAELVASGEMFGSAVLVPRTAGEKAAEVAIKAARGEDPGRTEFNNAEDLSPIGPKLTEDNVADFEAEWSVAD
jgi:ribose transport system substrate-binding protein